MKKVFLILALLISSMIMNAHNGDSSVEFYSNGVAKSKVIKHEGYSEVIKYYESGNQEEIQFYDLSNKRIGHWTRFYESGIVMGEANFKKDKKHGDWKIYDDNGNLNVYIKYKLGKKEVVCMLNQNKELAIR